MIAVWRGSSSSRGDAALLCALVLPCGPVWDMKWCPAGAHDLHSTPAGKAEPVEGGQAEPVEGGQAEPIQGIKAEPVQAGQAEPVQGGRAEPVQVDEAWQRLGLLAVATHSGAIHILRCGLYLGSSTYSGVVCA